MTFVKVVKSKAYHKRYQVKYRRRRSGQTDYYARRRLIFQEKKKYNTPKYRLVVRKTNRDVIAQVVYSKMEGDFVLASAYGHELAEFGVKAGFNNYAACYATGLLVARRLLTSLKLADTYTGNSETNGEFYNVEDHASDEGPQPFRCFLDVGLAPTTTGARIFGVLKGAVDGGLAVPHNNKRFPGYDTETKKLDAEVHRDYIFGAHVGSYMDDMKNGTEDAEDEEDRREAQPEKYAKHFSKYIAAGITGENIEEMYEKAHEEIRKNPTKKKAKSTKESERKDRRRKRLTLSQRKDRVKQRKETFLLKLQAAEEE